VPAVGANPSREMIRAAEPNSRHMPSAFDCGLRRERSRSTSNARELRPPYIERLSECERERFDAGIEKFDLKQALLDGSCLPNQLIEALVGHAAVTSIIDVRASG
jgi:hypothetical protein